METERSDEMLAYIDGVISRTKEYKFQSFAKSTVKVQHIFNERVRVYMFVEPPAVMIRPLYMAFVYYAFVSVFVGFTSWWLLGTILFLVGDFFLTGHALYYGFVRGARKKGIKQKIKRLDVTQCLCEVLE
jgi:hypothetical protein